MLGKVLESTLEPEPGYTRKESEREDTPEEEREEEPEKPECPPWSCGCADKEP